MKDKIKFIKELAKSINDDKLDGLEYENESEKFKISLKKKRKEKKVVVSQANQVINQQEDSIKINSSVKPSIKEDVVEEISGTKVLSPMVGTYYSKPSPTSEVFIKEGDKVVEGQTLCIVEAMKLMNEVKSPISGIIKKIFVADATSIKKGQLLVIIE